jgi:phospholipid/cholesterol/gamma-HCH transport system substrate-binding protein
MIAAEFEDALNLAIGAKVKVNGIDVGRVKEVTSKDFLAIAMLRVKQDSNIHRGATARLRYNTPLGELFVDILSPKTGTLLKDGDTMVPPVTSTAPTVEDALASASLLINGGGLEQLQTITEEFQKAVGQRGPTIRQLLDRTSNFLEEANATTGSIDRALTALASASSVLNARQDVINRAVHEITPVAKVLRENTDEVVALLQELVRLAQKANDLVGASRQELLATIRELGPVLDTFYSLRGRFSKGLRDLANLGQVLHNTVPGDFTPVEPFFDLGKTAPGARAGTTSSSSKSGKSTKSTDAPGLLQGLGLGRTGTTGGPR